MSKKEQRPIISTVEYYYTGDDKQFEQFLRSVIHDYITEDKTRPAETEEKSDNSEKIA